jgi:hypothetical protein
VTPIEYFPKHVTQIIPGDEFISLQVVKQYVSTSSEIPHVEGVATAEAKTTAAPCICTKVEKPG